MSEFVPDKNQILEKIIDSGIPPSAAEEAAALSENWIDRWAQEDAENWIIEAAEMPFYLWLDKERTALCIGVSDLRVREREGNILAHCEWKTATAPKPRARWGEDSWIEDLSNGPQLAVYGLAMREGRFWTGDGWIDGSGEAGKLLVRVCLKTSPATFWPIRGGVWEVQFDHTGLDRIKAVLLNEARAIQARRRTGLLPWMYTGNQCTNKFNRTCAFLEDCRKGKYPPNHGEIRFSTSDPGGQVLEHVRRLFPKEFESPDLVIISASAYGDAQQCAELYRRRNLAGSPKEENYALDVGTGVHAGNRELYSQIKEYQNAKT